MSVENKILSFQSFVSKRLREINKQLATQEIDAGEEM